jgi:NAD(P)-dependent dehydrogenase (short-subunit alcohol dehydrogenase family)
MNEIYQMFNLEGKTAIVTGASKGLGFGLAECFARAGMDLVLVNRNPQDGAAAEKKLSQYGRKVLSISADVSQSGEVAKMVEKAMIELGRIDVLVNNAAIINRGPLMTLSEEAWDQVIDINLKGYFLCGQAVAKHMLKQGGGKIINFASIRSHLVADERGAYCTSKGGITQLTKSMALEWARYNIRVNGIAPGYFATEMVSTYFEKMPEMEKKVVDGIPLSRIGRPEDLYGLALFLASKASDFITGEIININGGWSIWKY